MYTHVCMDRVSALENVKARQRAKFRGGRGRTGDLHIAVVFFFCISHTLIMVRAARSPPYYVFVCGVRRFSCGPGEDGEQFFSMSSYGRFLTPHVFLETVLTSTEVRTSSNLFASGKLHAQLPAGLRSRIGFTTMQRVTITDPARRVAVRVLSFPTSPAYLP